MRRSRLLCSLAAVAILLALQILSLWSFRWQSASCASSAALSQGCIRVWSSKPGDLPGAGRSSIGGWTGDVLLWKPEFSTASRLWVVPSAPPGVTPMARQVTGLCIVLPVFYPLMLSIGGAGLCLALPHLARARRVRAGRCPDCGYDMKGGTARCPECGNTLVRVLSMLRALLPRAPRAAR